MAKLIMQIESCARKDEAQSIRVFLFIREKIMT